jgi:hypothetical protein
MKGLNQHTKFSNTLLKRRNPKVDKVDDLINSALSGEGEGIVLIELPMGEPPEEDNFENMLAQGQDPLLPAIDSSPRVGIESNKSMRERLTREYGNGSPQVQILINAVVRLNAHSRKAKTVDAVLKLLNTIRQCLLTLETITGKGRGKMPEPPPNPLTLMTDEELDRFEAELAAILGKQCKA